MFDNGNIPMNNVVGNINYADENAGFKAEVKHIFESYNSEGVDLVQDFSHIIGSPTAREDFIGVTTESLTNSPLFTNAACASSPFYNNYNARVEQLMNNTMSSVATESAMTGYAPIVAYNPFFLKKQWIDCIFKDVLMTEIPKTPVINLAFERRYIKDLKGKRYPLPEALYDEKIAASLMDQATGYNIDSTVAIAIAECKALNILIPKYIPGIIAGDLTVELTPNIIISKVTLATTAGGSVTVPTNIPCDITTHNWIKGTIKYDVTDDKTGAFVETLTDELVGNVNFKEGKVTVMSTTGKVTHVFLKGKTANRWNQRSLDVERTVEQIQKVMPESGPRLNSAITVEEAADALALQNIDQIADNINIMGATLANFEDFEIKSFLWESFENQQKAAIGNILYDELNNTNMTAKANFNALPYEQYNGNITEWMKDAREYFERLLSTLKVKLRSTNMLFVAIAHPNTIRFLQDGINWVFSEDTQISGVRLAYNFGIYTSAQDRVHVVTTMRMTEADGIRFIGIPLTQELITFKHYKYNTIIDRNYRNPLYQLVPNIMCTQRTLTFEILPVQGVMTIDGRDLFSPETLTRPTDTAPTPDPEA